MDQSLQAAYGGVVSGVSLEQRNRVPRNTYWLLALSMVPTVLGAWIGVQTGIARAMSPGVGLIVFLGGAFGVHVCHRRPRTQPPVCPVLLAFTFFMA